jgi:outer membrane lipopolysaccharide assembly protein LptE/RlpB
MRALTHILAALLLLAFSGCAQYHFGNRSLFPCDVQTVYVPMFESNSFRRDLGERLTEAVVKEIERRSPYKVVSNPNADTVLTGRIVSDTKHLLVQTRNGDPRMEELKFQVQVSWIDRRGNAIRQFPPVPVPGECVTLTGAAGVVPEFGQSIATQQQKAIQKLAQQIVNMMETPW